MEWITQPEGWIALITLTALEIVLGVDNIIFISVVTGRLPKSQQAQARTIGLGLALGMRIVLLVTLSWVIGLTAPLFTIIGQEISGRDLILILGGLFLLAKATTEIHEGLEGGSPAPRDAVPVAGDVIPAAGDGIPAPGDAVPAPSGAPGGSRSFQGVLVQIVLLDAVFSLDSVITAVGMANEIPIMIAAV